MSPAADAVIKGKILRTDGVTPVVGATVSAKDNNDATAPVITAVSDSNGDYTLDRVPSQTTYTLTVTAVGFGESIPLSRVAPDPADPITTQRDAFIQAAKTYIGFDFQLKPEQGSATGKVLNNSDSSPIAGATVTATFGNQTVTAVTDGSGAYSFNKNNSPANGLDPGSWALVASAPGFGTNIAPVSVIVVSNQNTVAADIRLDPVLPGSVSGYVTRSTDGAGVSGVTVELRDQNGVLVKSGTTAADQTVNGYTFNFKIDAVPAGVTYTVSVSKTGFTPTPATRTATVTSNTETKNINFVLAPLHTFPGQLSMVSAPYDYNAFDVADLLSIPTGDRVPSIFRFGRWELQSYVFYPNPAASTFRLGKGYFISYTPNGAPRNMPLSTLGIAADDTRPFNVPLNAGWNMIGNPFTFAIDWTKVKVIDNGVVKSHDQAVADGAISSVVYGFVSGTYVLDFRLEPWLGYWVRALRNVTLQIDPTTDRLAGRAANVAGSSRAVLGAGDGWTIRLNAQVGNARDESTMVGVSSRASDAFDGFKAEKPPVLEGPFVRVSVDHPEWGQNAGEYGVDVRSAGLTTKSWSFSVTSNQPGKPITLTWPDAIASSRKVNLKLTDLSNGQVRDLRSASSYNWTAGQDESIRKFKLEAVAKTGTSDLKVSGLAARQPSRSSGMNVSYSLNSTADVEIRVLTTSGRAVRSVTGRSSRAAGTHQATWDLKDDKGISMPSGSYLVEVKAQNSDGQSARAVTQVITVR
jgi:flagellar hook assembly protein FlgD